MTSPSTKGSKVAMAGLFAGAVAVPPLGVNVTFPAGGAYTATAKQGRPMTPQDDALIDAKIKAEVAGVAGRIDVVDARLKAIDERLSLMSGVTADLAALKATVSELPRKGFIVTATVVALALIAAFSAFIQWGLSVHLLAGPQHL